MKKVGKIFGVPIVTMSRWRMAFNIWWSKIKKDGKIYYWSTGSMYYNGKKYKLKDK